MLLAVLSRVSFLLLAVLSRVHAAMGFLKTYKQEGREYFPTDDIFLDSSPFRDMPDDPYSECSLFSAECAAITHYNFLDNVKIPHEAGLDKYDFNTWDFDAFGYPRWSINAFVFKGSDLIDEHISNEDDEQDIAVELPKAKGKHCGAVGKALIVHLSYVFQRQAGFDKQTNLAAHYVALARNLTGPLLDV